MQAQVVQAYALWQRGADEGGEMGQQVLAGGLEREGHQAFEPLGLKPLMDGATLLDGHSMVESTYYQFVHKMLEVGEVHHHALLWALGVGVGLAQQTHIEHVGVAMQMATWAIVAIEGVGHLEAEGLCNADVVHIY